MATPPDSGTASGLPFCREFENLATEGDARSWPADRTSADGVLILAPDNGGRVQVDFVLDTAAVVELWARVRAGTFSNNSVFVGLDGLEAEPTDAASWDVPVTPVLSWQRILPRGADGEEWRPQDGAWPGSLDAGAHRLIVAGREPDVELDAFCVMPAGMRPAQRYIAPPAHTTLVDAASFGAIGDGEADDTAALQMAFDALEEGETLRIPAGRFRTTSALRLRTSDVTVEGTLDDEGARQTTLFFDHPADPPNGSTGGIVVVGHDTGEFSSLRADAVPFQRTIVVGAGEPFAEGDLIVVDSDPWGPDNEDLLANGQDPSQHHRFLRVHAQVMSRTVDGDEATLVLDRPFLEPFSVDHNARVAVFHPLENIVIRGMRLEGTQRQLGDDDSEWTDDERARNPDINFVRMRRVANSFVYNLEILHFRDRGALFNDTFNMQFFDNEVHDATDFDGGGRGYGFLSEMSQAVSVYRNTLRGVMRHSLSFTVGTLESSITDNDMERGTNETEPSPAHLWACIDIHGEHSYGLLIARNHTVRGEYGVIIGGGFGSHGNDGQWIVVRDNLAESHFGGGVGTNDHSYDAIFEHNELRGNDVGVMIFQKNDRTYVWNNRIDGWYMWGAGIRIEDSDETQIIGNRFRAGPGFSGGESDLAIEIDADSSDYLIQNNDLDGNRMDEPGTGTIVP